MLFLSHIHGPMDEHTHTLSFTDRSACTSQLSRFLHHHEAQSMNIFSALVERLGGLSMLRNEGYVGVPK